MPGVVIKNELCVY